MSNISFREGIGFFGGTFDPIHFGHLKMAEELRFSKRLEEVWFSPARINPFKRNAPPLSIAHRLNMIKLAIEPYPYFRLIDLEASQPGPSYTIDALRTLLVEEEKRENPRQIYLILSDEAVSGFFEWKEAVEIVERVPLLIGSRTGVMPSMAGKDLRIIQAVQKGWLPTSQLPISSTEIRKKLKEGRDCSRDLPKKVLDYIYHNRLYSTVAIKD